MGQSMLTLHPTARGIHAKNLYLNLKVHFVYTMQNRVFDAVKKVAPALADQVEIKRRENNEEFDADNVFDVFDRIVGDVGIADGDTPQQLHSRIEEAVIDQSARLIDDITSDCGCEDCQVVRERALKTKESEEKKTKKTKNTASA